MSKISFPLTDDAHLQAYDGQRVSIYQEPDVKLPKAKKKALLRSKGKQQDNARGPKDTSPENVYTSRVNWIGTLDRDR